MAHNSRIRADLAAWSAYVPVDPAEFEALDQAQYESINGDDGGTWNPAAFITIGGAGLYLSGTNHRIAGTLLNYGVFSTTYGAQILVTGNGAASSYTMVDFSAGAGMRLIGVSAAIYARARFGAWAEAEFIADGRALFATGSTLLAESGSAATWENGCVVTHSNATTFDATSYCYWAASSHFAIQAGCLTSVAADLNISSADLLVTSGAVRMGVGGSIVHKIVPIATDASYAIDLTAGDSFKHTSGGLTGDQIWYLPVAAETGQRIAIRNLHVTHSILLYEGGFPYSPIASLRNFAGQIGSCELEWNSTDWEVVSTYTVL